MAASADPLPAHVRLEGSFWTADPAHARATSIDLAGGTIAAVDAPARPGVPVVTLVPGAVALPGIIDAHLHLTLGALGLAQVDLSPARSRADFESMIADAARTIAPGRWLRAHGWDESRWGGERPTRDWLRTAGTVPCVAYRMDHHACVVNDAVLAMIGDAPCPDGGEIVRDTRGRATGLLLEQAAWQLVNPRIPVPPAADRQAAVRRAIAHCHSFGITAVGSMEYEADLREVYEPMRARDPQAFTLRVLATILDREWPVDRTWGAAFPADERLRIVGWKSFADGTLGSRTARMLRPYADDGATRGMLVEFAAHSTERVRTWAADTLAAGFSPATHVIGDEALRITLDAIEPVDPNRLARYEHCQTIDDADLPRMRGRIASMQPLHKAHDAAVAPVRLGADRMRAFFRFRDLADAGAHLAFGSDWPIVSCDPWLGIRTAVTGLDVDGRPCRTDQNLSVEESLVAYTRGAADALRAPDLGRLAPGMCADLCILASDPFSHDWSRGTPLVAATIAGGRLVHGAVGARVASPA
ncbi:MAG: amidohydrolase [Phycisphaerales bacterium]